MILLFDCQEPFEIYLVIFFINSFQERGKRIRLHQFIVDKAPQLFKADKTAKESLSWAFKAEDEGNLFLI